MLLALISLPVCSPRPPTRRTARASFEEQQDIEVEGGDLNLELDFTAHMEDEGRRRGFKVGVVLFLELV